MSFQPPDWIEMSFFNHYLLHVQCATGSIGALLATVIGEAL